METFQCMLAGKAPKNLNTLLLPTSGSWKLDGIRALNLEGVMVSRKMKPLPSEQVQEMFGDPTLDGLDGEIIAGPANAEDVYRRSMSSIMSGNNPDDLTFYVFDDYSEPDKPHSERLKIAARKIGKRKNFVIVKHHRLETVADILALEAEALEQGYEGLMLRSLGGKYKFGRSTEREQYLLKLKRFEDSEAVIHEVVELMHNDNEKTINETGHAKRSSHKANLRPAGKLGAVEVEDVKTRVRFSVGTGFNDADRVALWGNRKNLPGMVIKYRYFPGGSKEKPRFPTFVGFRDAIDM